MSTVEFAAWRAKLARQTPSVVKQVIIQNSDAAKLEQKQREIEALLEGIEKQHLECERLKIENALLQKELTRLEEVLKQERHEILTPGRVSLARLSRFVVNEFGYGLDDIQSKVKTKNISLARQAAMYFGLSLAGSKKVGRFWDRDHSTVIHASEKIEKMCRERPDFAAKIADIKEKLEKLNAPVDGTRVDGPRDNAGV